MHQVTTSPCAVSMKPSPSCEVWEDIGDGAAKAGFLGDKESHDGYT